MAESPFSPEQIKQLEQPLERERVKHRQGGGGAQLAYLKGHDVIDTANRIFGFGSWGYDLLGVDLLGVPGETGEIVGHYYAARVRLTVAGCVPVTEEGVCPVQEGRNPRARIDAHDMARKGAITDALKRALRCFGDQFGNSLYDTDLVDGQPKGSAPRPAARPGSNAPLAAKPAPVAAKPTVAPSAPAPAPVPAPTPVRPAAEAPRPQAAPESVPATAAPKAAPAAALATDQQMQAIKKLAGQRKLSQADVENQVQRLYGSSLKQLTHADAGDLIKRLSPSSSSAA